MSRSGEDDPATYLVAYDGSDDSDRALRRAAAFADRTDARLLVASVLPTDALLAETYDLTDDGEYDPDAAAERLRAAAAEVAPDAGFRAERVDAYAGRRRIAKVLSRVADQEAAEVVFVGGDDAGRVVQRLSSTDGASAESVENTRFDVFVVRST